MTSQPTIPADPLENTPNYPTWVTDELLRDYYDTECGRFARSSPTRD